MSSGPRKIVLQKTGVLNYGDARCKIMTVYRDKFKSEGVKLMVEWSARTGHGEKMGGSRKNHDRGITRRPYLISEWSA